MREFNAVITENTELQAGIFNLWLMAEHSLDAIPGQFINVYLDRPDMLLPRPISVCGVKDNAVRLIYQIAGKGTDYLSRLKPGKLIRAVGPLGNGFNCVINRSHTEFERPLIIGGGIGVPPLLFLAKALIRPLAILGFRSASSAILIDEFVSLGCETITATDDGGLGYKGNAIEAVRAHVNARDISSIYACGPRIMLKGAAEYAIEKNIPCQISMEERMGCGIGACLCCPAPVMENGKIIYKKLCKDGPVFEAGSIIWRDTE